MHRIGVATAYLPAENPLAGPGCRHRCRVGFEAVRRQLMISMTRASGGITFLKPSDMIFRKAASRFVSSSPNGLSRR